MATKKELMSYGKGQKQQVYRRGRVERSAAGVDSSVTGYKRTDSEKDYLATFLGEVVKTVPGAWDQWNKQENIDNEEKLEKGRAAFKNANPKQRKKFRDAIWSGELEPDESPYFREGLQIAQTETIVHRYGPELFVAYENWEGKNSSDPEAFNNFIGEFNEQYRPDLNSIDDGVKKDHFWPKQTALISQLQAQHQQKSAETYRKNSKLLEEDALGIGLDPGGVTEVDNAATEDSLPSVINTEHDNGVMHNAVGKFYDEKFKKKKGTPDPIVVDSADKKIALAKFYPSLADEEVKVVKNRVKKKEDETFIDESLAAQSETDNIFSGITSEDAEPYVPEHMRASVEPKPKKPKLKDPSDIEHMKVTQEVVSSWAGPDLTRDQHGIVYYGKNKKGLQRVNDFRETLTEEMDAIGLEGKYNMYVTEGGSLRVQFGAGVNEEDQAKFWSNLTQKHKIGAPIGSKKTKEGRRLQERTIIRGKTKTNRKA